MHFLSLGGELGPEGLARFLRLYSSGSGDYTRDRDKLLADVTLMRSSARSVAPTSQRLTAPSVAPDRRAPGQNSPPRPVVLWSALE